MGHSVSHLALSALLLTIAATAAAELPTPTPIPTVTPTPIPTVTPIPTPCALPAPTNVNVTVSYANLPDSITNTITWSAVPGAAGYVVSRAMYDAFDNVGPFVPVTSPPITSTTYDDAVSDGDYSYFVSAVCPGGNMNPPSSPFPVSSYSENYYHQYDPPPSSSPPDPSTVPPGDGGASTIFAWGDDGNPNPDPTIAGGAGAWKYIYIADDTHADYSGCDTWDTNSHACGRRNPGLGKRCEYEASTTACRPWTYGASMKEKAALNLTGSDYAKILMRSEWNTLWTVGALAKEFQHYDYVIVIMHGHGPDNSDLYSIMMQVLRMGKHLKLLQVMGHGCRTFKNVPNVMDGWADSINLRGLPGDAALVKALGGNLWVSANQMYAFAGKSTTVASHLASQSPFRFKLYAKPDGTVGAKVEVYYLCRHESTTSDRKVCISEDYSNSVTSICTPGGSTVGGGADPTTEEECGKSWGLYRMKKK